MIYTYYFVLYQYLILLKLTKQKKVPYLLLGLQDVQWAVGNSRGARQLARTPHVNQKKKKLTKQPSRC